MSSRKKIMSNSAQPYGHWGVPSYDPWTLPAYGPFFVNPSHEDDAAFTKEFFPIIDLESFDGINVLPEMTIYCALPPDVAKLGSKPLASKQSSGSFKHLDYDSTEDFLSAQLFKNVIICFPRPEEKKKRSSLFEPQTFWHGIITKCEVVPTPRYDTVRLTIQPPLALLLFQNNYRSFENKTTQEILNEVFDPYLVNLKNEKFEIKLEIVNSPKRIQTLQNGEDDYHFFIRLLKEEGLSFFFVHKENKVTVIVTDELIDSFKKVRNEFSEINEDLTFFPSIAPLALDRSLESSTLPIYGYEVGIAPHTQKITLFDGFSKDFRLADRALEPKSIEYENKSADLAASKVFLPTKMEPMSLTRLADLTTDERNQNFDTYGNRTLNLSRSKSHHRSGIIRLFGFWPIWRTCLFDTNLLTQRHNVKTDYASNFLNKSAQEYQAWFVTHKLIQSYDKPFYAFCEIVLNFMRADDESFRCDYNVPSDFIQQNQNSAGISKPMTGIVLGFDDNKDNTTKDFEIPNMIRVRLPWHDEKKNESIRARWSTFWASKEFGSLFMPEVGDEVLIVFLEGDPDYPVIVNSLYNARNSYPLKVAAREQAGPFERRGIIFKEQEAAFTYGPVKKDDKTVQILSLTTEEGNFENAAANIDVTASDTYTLDVQKPKTTIVVDENKLDISALNNSSNISFEKDKLTLKSKDTSVDGSSTVDISSKDVSIKGSSQISANSLKLPG